MENQAETDAKNVRERRGVQMYNNFEDDFDMLKLEDNFS